MLSGPPKAMASQNEWAFRHSAPGLGKPEETAL